MWWQYLVLALLIIATVLMALALGRTIFKLYVSLQGPFFAPTSNERIKTIIKLATLKPGMKVADLGSGDGRILIALAQAASITAVGYEIDPVLVRQSRAAITRAKLDGHITIKPQSFWGVDLSSFDVITIYCVERFMGKLEKKLQKELTPKTKVISVFFQFPHWRPVKKLGDLLVYRRER